MWSAAFCGRINAHYVHPHQSTVGHSASANAYFLAGPADKASPLVLTFQNALGITTREVAAFLGHKHEIEARLPVQNWPQAESDACTSLVGIATAAFRTVASIAFDGATDRLEDLDD